MFKKITTNSLLALSVCASVAQAVTIKTADEVFASWQKIQRVVPDRPLNYLASQLNEKSFIESFKATYEQNIQLLGPIKPLLGHITAGTITPDSYRFTYPIADTFKNNLDTIYNTLELKLDDFVNAMKKTMLTSPEHRSLENGNPDASIHKYVALFQLLYATPDQELSHDMQFALSNRFFEYCFTTPSFSRNLQPMLMEPKTYPVARSLYAVTWFNLAGNGWKHWHQDSLDELKKRSDEGKEIVYIAGGSDIYQMLKAGIFRIRNIDPQLPSQPKYYTNDWQFILSSDGFGGGMGDQIHFKTNDGKNMIMERAAVAHQGEAFQARLASNETIALPKTITTWLIKDEEGNQVGQYVLERRFCNQSDFQADATRTLLMSFNELHFIAQPAFLGGWGIEPAQFDEKLDIVIKQLRKPVTKDTIFNIRIAAMINNTDFKYIALGTCIN
jgi:phage protein U